MPIRRFFQKAAQIYFWITLSAVGLLFLVIGLLALRAPEAEYLPTTATITAIEEEYDAFAEETRMRVLVEYEAEGVRYSDTELDSYSSSMRVGDTLEAEYRADDPAQLRTSDGKTVLLVVLTVGASALLGGLFMTVRTARKKTEDDYNKVDMTKAPAHAAESKEPMQTYVFRLAYQGLREGYVMEDEARSVVYEGRMLQNRLLRPCPFLFYNHLTGRKKERMVGHVTTSTVGGGEGRMGIPVQSSFRLDGERNWDFLAAKGYGFTVSYEGLARCCDVACYGTPVASIRTLGADPHEDGGKNLLRKLPVNGNFRVTCRESDLDMIFLLCFCLARTEAT